MGTAEHRLAVSQDGAPRAVALREWERPRRPPGRARLDSAGSGRAPGEECHPTGCGGAGAHGDGEQPGVADSERGVRGQEELRGTGAGGVSEAIIRPLIHQWLLRHDAQDWVATHKLEQELWREATPIAIGKYDGRIYVQCPVCHSTGSHVMERPGFVADPSFSGHITSCLTKLVDRRERNREHTAKQRRVERMFWLDYARSLSVSGVYVIYNGDATVYVGESSCVLRRSTARLAYQLNLPWGIIRQVRGKRKRREEERRVADLFRKRGFLVTGGK